MAHILIAEELHALKHRPCSLIAYGTVGGVLYHMTELDHILKHLHVRLALHDGAHHMLYLLEAVAAGNAFAAGLAPRALQESIKAL